MADDDEEDRTMRGGLELLNDLHTSEKYRRLCVLRKITQATLMKKIDVECGGSLWYFPE